MKVDYYNLFLSLIIVVVVTFISSPVSAQGQGITIDAQEQKTYTIYVQPNSIYQNYYSNVMEDATTAWHNANPNINFVLEYSPAQPYNFEVQWIVSNTGDPWAGEALISSNVMQVVLGDSFCGGIWQPYSHVTLVSLATHELGHLLGMGHSTDPNNVMNPNRNDFEYGARQYVPSLPSGGFYSIPLCNSWDNTSISFNLSTPSKLAGVNYYFVPTNPVSTNFQYYDSQGCYGKSVISAQGTCSGMAKDGYLIIGSPPLLVNTFTTVTVNLVDTTQQPQYYVPTIPVCPSGQQLEIDNNVGQYGQQCVQITSTIQQPSPQGQTQLPQWQTQLLQGQTSNGISVNMNQIVLTPDRDAVVMTVAGLVSNNLNGYVDITIKNQNGLAMYDNLIQPASDYSFNSRIPITELYPTGTYSVSATYENNYLGSTSFQVINSITTPEFGSLAPFVLVISIVSIIIISKKTSENF